MLKKTIYLSLGIALVFAAQGCKKGEEDPFLSLRSRKARLTGEWKLSAGTEKVTEDGVVVYNQTLDGSNSKDMNGNSFTYSQNYTFEKDGTYQIVTVDDGDTGTEKGNWAFIGKNKADDMKKKEFVYLDQTSYSGVNSTSTNSNFEDGNGTTFQLVKLSNKEIIMSFNYSTKDASGSLNIDVNYTLTKK